MHQYGNDLTCLLATKLLQEKRLERYERGSEDTPVTFVADALPLADLVRDNARSALLREAVAYLEEGD